MRREPQPWHQIELAACNTLENSALHLTLPPDTTRLRTPSQRRPTPPGPRVTRAFGVPRRPTNKNVGVRRLRPRYQ